MTFKQAFFEAAAGRKMSAKQKAKLKKLQSGEGRHRLFWAAAENMTVRRYRRQTGKTVKDFGDGQFLQYLFNNLPALLEKLMKLLAIFGF